MPLWLLLIPAAVIGYFVIKGAGSTGSVGALAPTSLSGQIYAIDAASTPPTPKAVKVGDSIAISAFLDPTASMDNQTGIGTVVKWTDSHGNLLSYNPPTIVAPNPTLNYTAPGQTPDANGMIKQVFGWKFIAPGTVNLQIYGEDFTQGGTPVGPFSPVFTFNISS